MADLPHYPDSPGSNDETGAPSDEKPATGTAWWVYALWIGGIALVVLFVVLHLTGTMGPGGH